MKVNGWRVAGRILGAVTFILTLALKRDFVSAAISGCFWWGILEGIGWIVDRTRAETIAQVAARRSLPGQRTLPDYEQRDAPRYKRPETIAKIAAPRSIPGQPELPHFERPGAAAYTDQQCKYLGGDPRFGELGILELNREASVAIESDILSVTVSAANNPTTVRYPASDLWQFAGAGQHCCHAATTYETLGLAKVVFPGPKSVYVLTRDPNGIVGAFWVCLGFRSEYYAQLFLRRAYEEFGLLDASVIRERYEDLWQS